MSNSCKLTPDASNGKESKLFRDLVAHLGNRDAAKQVWAFTKLDMFTSEFKNLEKDENGEPTYQAIEKVLNLDNLFGSPQKDINLAIDMGILTSGTGAKKFDTPQIAMQKADEYNSRTKTRTASVRETDDGKYTIELNDTSPNFVAEADKNTARLQLNKSLLALVERIGFSVEFVNDPTFTGVFNPMVAEQNADTLVTAIRVANNEVGAETLPEEVAHLVIAGLANHQLKLRADSVFTPQVVKAVLGDSYNAYYEKYKDGKMPVEERLREEAEGKVLADILKGRESSRPVTEQPAGNILKRLWNYALTLFRKLTKTDIDNAFIQAENAMRNIAEEMRREDFDTIVDRELIMQHEAMYRLADDAKTAEERWKESVERAESVLMKKEALFRNTASPAEAKRLSTQIKKIYKQINDEQYAAAAYGILASIGSDIRGMLKEVERLGGIYNESTNLNVIAAEGNLVRRMYAAVQAYMPFLETLADIKVLIKSGQIELNDEDAEWIDILEQKAEEYRKQLRSISREIKQMRFSVLKQLIKLYYGNYGEKPDDFVETERHKWESADMILRQAQSDISFWDGRFFSASDSRSPLLNVIHKIIVSQQAKRDNLINKRCMKLQEAHARLHRAGYDDKFVYQYDENGVPTGYYVGPVDVAKFEKDRADFFASLPEEMDYYEQQKAIEKWEAVHMKEVEITYGEPVTASGVRRKEKMPDPEIYKVENFQEGWSKEQKDYYKALMDMKADMDSLLPTTMQGLYVAPQVLKSVTQLFDKDGQGAVKTLWKKWKQNVSVTTDNLDYGLDSVYEQETDMANRIVKRVPIYFVRQLEDMRDLSTDATHAMFNYIAMATNYSEMGKLADVMELMKDHSREDLEIVRTNAGKPVIDSFKSVLGKLSRKAVVTGESTNTVQAIVDFIDRTLYNETKNKMGDIKHPFREDKTISKDSVFNTLLRMTSISRMGINVLSGMTNALQGETQMFVEAMTGRYFNMKDLSWAKKEYGILLPEYMGHFNSPDRHDKMYMLINQFNSSEDFFRDMRDKDFNKSAFKRVLGRGNVYFLNTMGEHYLHTTGMLVVLKHEKVIRLSDKDRKEVSLYDVIKQVHDKDGWHLELDDDIEFVNKNRGFLQDFHFTDKAIVKKEDRNELFERLNLYINNLNAGMHGGYSEAEKGNINKMALGRAITQFRQWMFGMYNKLYSRSYYDAVMGVTREGSYITIFNWIIGTIHDMKNMSLKMALEHNKMTKEQRDNAKLAWTQAGLYLSLVILCMLTAGWKDKDDRNLRLLAYNLKRLKLETGALSITNPVDFLRNIFTLVQSPAAGVRTIETLTDAFDLLTWTQIVQSGRFKGWWKPAKALWTITPLYNVQKVIDMKDYSYMFNIFK